MRKIKKILAPTDLSELSRSGISYALDIARAEDAEIILYHVITYKEASVHDEGFLPGSLSKWLIEERRKSMDEFIGEHYAEFLPKLRVRREVEVGVPHRKIVEKAQSESADLIIMSTHGRTGMLHLLIGSVTEKVVRLATSPVLAIRPPQERKRAREPAARGSMIEI